ncbi:MAG: phosphoenolpyruvate--protein phosphotransferase [Nocardioidaceae bacterium]
MVEDVTAEVTVVNEHGLHARPAAVLVSAARRYDAAIRLTNVTGSRGPVDVASLSAVATLGARRGDTLLLAATGPQAADAVTSLRTLVSEGFGEEVTQVPETGDDEPTLDEVDSHQQVDAPCTASPGIGVGPAWYLDDVPVDESALEPADPLAQRQRLEAAVAGARADLTASRERSAELTGPAEAAIFDAHLLLLDDPSLTGEALARIAPDVGAVTAWRWVVDNAAAAFDALPDEYQRARAADVQAVGATVLRHLTGVAGPGSQPGVLIARAVTPEQVTALDPAEVEAVVTVEGSATSHAAILARALGIPMVVGIGGELLDTPAGSLVAVDADAATVEVGPARQTIDDLRLRAKRLARADAQARFHAREPAFTRDGTRIHVAANVASPADAAAAAAAGAEGVGLLRTELFFLDRPTMPSEEQQVEAVLAVARALDGARVTVRTLDVGGDKPLPYLRTRPEANPFLGLRGLRLSLARPRVFHTQLRAIVRAAEQTPISVMFPMVSTRDELVRARDALSAAAAALGLPRLPDGLEVGVMIEVPAAALTVQHLADLVDFVSIGTNDLTQYVMAAERGNAAVAYLADALEPAVLFLIDRTCNQVKGRARVAVCGEVAGNPEATALLLGLGVDELSMAPRSVPAVKQAAREADLAVARKLADGALRCESVQDVRALLRD